MSHAGRRSAPSPPRNLIGKPEIKMNNLPWNKSKRFDTPADTRGVRGSSAALPGSGDSAGSPRSPPERLSQRAYPIPCSRLPSYHLLRPAMTTKVDDHAPGAKQPAFGNGWKQFSNLTGERCLIHRSLPLPIYFSSKVPHPPHSGTMVRISDFSIRRRTPC